jgi:hypothetical protein
MHARLTPYADGNACGWEKDRLEPVLIGCGRGGLAAQKALAAKDGTSLGGLEGYRSFPTALRTTGHGLGLCVTARGALALSLAVLTALGLVLEILVVEEVLFSRCEYKLCSAVYTFKCAVLKLRHSNCAP